MAGRENRYRDEILSHRRSQYNEVGTPAVRLDIGNALRNAREQLGLTLEFVNSITKINIRFLEAIEEGRWNFLPPTYVKAFIKAYSSAIQDPIDNLHRRLDEIFETAIMPYSPLRTTLEKVTPDEEEIFRGGKISQ
ncbi:MAG: helix-turn-helix domain-containing protein, partial [bacterium]